MNCPLCALPLHRIILEPHLPAHTCLQCNGVWIASSDYWAWLEQPAVSYDPTRAEAPTPARDPARAKRCPGCGHIVLSYPVNRALPFRIDQCGHCNSFWLDRGEWDVLRQQQLHRLLHKITNEPWQRQLRAEERRATWEAIYTARFGADDYAEIQRIRAWLTAHPQRAMLLAFLTSPDPYNL